MRRYSLLAFLVLVLGSLASQADDFIHQPTGLEFPKKIGTMRQGDPISVRESGTTIIPYSAAGFEVTIYIRNASDDSKVTAGSYLAESLSAIRELAKRGIYTEIGILPKVAKNDRDGWARVLFKGNAEGKRFISWIHTTVHEGHPVKVRVTSDVPMEDEMEGDVARLQRVIDGRISSLSSPCLREVREFLSRVQGKEKEASLVPLFKSYHSDQTLHEEVMQQIAKALPKEYAEALKSSGNMHNPKVVPLRAIFDEALLKTPTMLKIASELAKAGYQIDGISFEKFWIETGTKDGAEPRALAGYIALKVSPVED